MTGFWNSRLVKIDLGTSQRLLNTPAVLGQRAHQHAQRHEDVKTCMDFRVVDNGHYHNGYLSTGET